jgi:hypothetical protein
MVKNYMKYFAEDKVYLDKKELLSTNVNAGPNDNIILVSGKLQSNVSNKLVKMESKKSIKSIRLN